jgi:hypothetical protein
MTKQELSKAFLNAIKVDNKPEALKHFSGLVQNRIRERIDQKKASILASKKI